MPNAYFLAFEVFEVVLFVVLAVHAFRGGSVAVTRLAAGLLYGFLLELLSIRQTSAYQYGEFTLNIFQVPVVIGIAWANQLYAARLFSDSTSLPEWGRAVFDALLVAYLDLLVEPVATRLGFWEFGTPPDYQWFGTPYPNFLGFLWIVTSFSASSRLLARTGRATIRNMAPLLAIAIGTATLFCVNAVMLLADSDLIRTTATAVLVVLSVGSVLALRVRLTHAPPPASLLFFSTSLAFFLAIGLISRVILAPPPLLVISLSLFAAGVLALARAGRCRMASSWRR